MSTLTINLNPDIKHKAQKKARNEGLTLTAIISQFLKEYIGGRLGFGLTSNEAALLSAREEAMEDLMSGKAKLYSSAEEMSEDILSEPDDDEI